MTILVQVILKNSHEVVGKSKGVNTRGDFFAHLQIEIYIKETTLMNMSCRYPILRELFYNDIFSEASLMKLVKYPELLQNKTSIQALTTSQESNTLAAALQTVVQHKRYQLELCNRYCNNTTVLFKLFKFQ